MRAQATRPASGDCFGNCVSAGARCESADHQNLKIPRFKSQVQPAVQLNREAVLANAFDRITQDPSVLAGRATIRGLRISVAHVVNLVANGMAPAEIVQELPDLEEEDVRQALAYAAALAHDEVHPLRA